MQRRLEYEASSVELLLDDDAAGDGHLDRLRREVAFDIEQLYGLRQRFIDRDPAVPPLARRVDDMAHARHQPKGRSSVVTQAARHRVGRTEADPADLVHEAKRILSNRRHRAVAVLLLNAKRARATKAGRGQKDHQVAHGPLRLPARLDLPERLSPDPGNLTKALRLLVNDPKKLGAEAFDEPPRQRRS